MFLHEMVPSLLAQLPAGALAKSADAIIQADSALRMTLFQTIVKWSFSFTFIGMAVATVFLLIESTRVAAGHRLSILVGGLITFAATISYYYMSTTWVPGHYYVTEFRYADWTITTPLLLLKLCAMAGKRRVGNGTMVALVSADLFMIITGYIGEQAINLRGAAGILAGNTALPLWMFLFSCVGWLAVMAILFGPVKGAALDAEPEERNAVNAMILFVVVGWAVYPLGYLFRLYWAPFGYVGDLTQLLWNVGDFTNKAIYGYVAWTAAQALTERLYGPRGERAPAANRSFNDGGRAVDAPVGSPVGTPVMGTTVEA